MKLDFLKSIVSESDGSGSTTRCLMVSIVLFALSVGVFLCGELHYHHITVEQLNNYLSTGGQFVVTTTGPLYLINKAHDAYTSKQEQDKT